MTRPIPRPVPTTPTTRVTRSTLRAMRADILLGRTDLVLARIESILDTIDDDMTRKESVTTDSGLATPDEWMARTGIVILDPDGWRDEALDWSTPITEEKFYELEARSTSFRPLHP